MKSQRASNPNVPKKNAIWRVISRWFGSLQLAVILLPLLAATLVLGTFVESWFDRQHAVQLVYSTWWFLTLLTLLALNVLFAALKKWPWRKHQTGFLVTHAGLLTLIAGGAISSLGGLQGTVILVDSPDPRAARFGPHRVDAVVDQDQHQIVVLGGGRVLLAEEFSPGVHPWTAGRAERPGLLPHLARPFGTTWSRVTGDGLRVSVEQWLPQAERIPFSATESGDESSFPAIELNLGSAATGILPPRWLAGTEAARRQRWGPGLIEFLGQGLSPTQVHHFQQPAVGTAQGRLVVGRGDRSWQFEVDELLGTTGELTGGGFADGTDGKSDGRRSLNDSDWTVQPIEYLPDFLDPTNSNRANPGLSFELSDGATSYRLAITARYPGRVFPLRDSPVQHAPEDFWFWFHAPDHRGADERILGVLQFATTGDQQLVHRAFATVDGEVQLEQSGTVTAGRWQPVWQAMDWRFRVTNHIPSATGRPRCIPSASPEARPAVKLRLETDRLAESFWLPKSTEAVTHVEFGQQRLALGYHTQQFPLDFALTLVQANQELDPGTGQPASELSRVLLDDPRHEIHDQPHTITMNEPLSHRGYKFYQSQYEQLGKDEGGKVISRSVLIVGHDPGVNLKYAGSAMVALGIAFMFYIRPHRNR